MTKRSTPKQDWSRLSSDQDTGSRIRHLRINILDLSQDEFAEKIDVTRGAVSNWERGTAAVGQGNLKRIVDAFPPVTMEWLTRGVGQPGGDPHVRPTLAERMRLLPPAEYERLHIDIEALLDSRLSYLDRASAAKATPKGRKT